MVSYDEHFGYRRIRGKQSEIEGYFQEQDTERSVVWSAVVVLA